MSLIPEQLNSARSLARQATEEARHAVIEGDFYEMILAHIDEQARTIQRVRELLIPSFYSRAEANQLLNKIQAALNDGDQ